MAESCCQAKSEDLAKLAERQARVLWTVLIINLVMFFIEFYSGLKFDSVALMGDSLDMFGDSLAYGSSLFVLGLGLKAKARASQLKGAIMVLLGLVVAAQAIYRTLYSITPSFEGMGGIGLLALAANIVCLFLLTRHKNDDVNFSSVWICSRNDIVANTSVLVAAALVFLTGSPWPDLVIGIGIAALFVKSALGVFKDSQFALQAS